MKYGLIALARFAWRISVGVVIITSSKEMSRYVTLSRVTLLFSYEVYVICHV